MLADGPHRVVCHLDELLAARGLAVAAFAWQIGVTVVNISVLKIQRAKARSLYEAGELKKKEADGKIGIAKRVLESQFAHLKLSIFGGKK